MMGALILPNPLGLPRFRSVMRVPPPAVSVQAYVVSMGNGPSFVAMTSRSPGTKVSTSYV